MVYALGKPAIMALAIIGLGACGGGEGNSNSLPDRIDLQMGTFADPNTRMLSPGSYILKAAPQSDWVTYEFEDTRHQLPERLRNNPYMESSRARRVLVEFEIIEDVEVICQQYTDDFKGVFCDAAIQAQGHRNLESGLQFSFEVEETEMNMSDGDSFTGFFKVGYSQRNAQ